MTPGNPSPFELDVGHVRPAQGGPTGAAGARPQEPLELPAGAVRRHYEEPAAATVPPPRRRRALAVFAAGASTFVVALLAVEAFSYAFALFERQPALGGVLGLLAAVTLGSGLYAVTAESRALSRQMRGLREAAALREEARPLLDEATESRGRAAIVAARVVALYENRPELAEATDLFKASMTTAHSDREILSLLVRQVLQPLDARAYRVVSRAARDTGIGVTLSPAGLIDAALVLWRTNRMIRDVALVYGFRPGSVGRFVLLRRVLENAAMAGAVEYFGDLLTAHIGAGIAGRLSSRLGQGAFTAVRTARLGLIAIDACRPIPFTEEDRASLASLRREIVGAFAERGQQDGA